MAGGKEEEAGKEKGGRRKKEKKGKKPSISLLLCRQTAELIEIQKKKENKAEHFDC